MRGGTQHRVFAADLIGVGRHAERLLDAPDHVQIGHAGLDHHHVGALLQVERDLAQRLVAVGRVHLVGALVGAAERRFRADRIAERAIKSRGIFCRIGHDTDPPKPGFVERMAHRADPAVHHVGRRDDVAARSGLDDRLVLQDLDCFVILDIAVADDPVMPVRGERVERHIAQHAEFRQGLFHSRDRAANEIAWVHRVAAFRIFEGVRHRREYGDRRYAELGRLSGSVDQRRDRQAEDVRHRRDRRPVALVMDKDRPDQVARGQHGLGDELARPGIAAVAPQTRLRIRGERRQERGHGITPEIESGEGRESPENKSKRRC